MFPGREPDMDGIHDLGGMHGFGRIPLEDGESRFRAAWEGRVAAMLISLLARGYIGLDAFRHGIETMDPVDYLSFPYFGRWRHSVERNLIRGGWIGADEIDRARREVRASRRLRGTPRIRGAAPDPPAPGFVRDVARAPRFAVGGAVRARCGHPAGHTRLPRYARGKRGRIERVHAAFVFPDSNAHGRGESPQHLYTVRFDGRELWSDDAEPASCVSLDLFESYLEPLEGGA
jgi:nitrile hydratase